MQARAHELGGTLEVRRARLGGVRVAVRIPVPEPAVDAERGADEATGNNGNSAASAHAARTGAQR